MVPAKCNGRGDAAAVASTSTQPDVLKFGSLRYRYTPAGKQPPLTSQLDETSVHGQTPLATDSKITQTIISSSALGYSFEPEHKGSDIRSETNPHQAPLQSGDPPISFLAALRQNQPAPSHQTLGVIRLNAPLQPNVSLAPRVQGADTGHRSRSAPPAWSSSQQTLLLNPYASSFDILSMERLSLADHPVDARQSYPLAPAIGTGGSVATQAQTSDWQVTESHGSKAPTTGRDAAALPKDEALVNQLRRKRAPPPKGVFQDPFYIFARFGKAGEVTPLVITENVHMRQSLISEKLAKKLCDSRNGWKGKRDSRRKDRWIVANVSWPYDAAHPDIRPKESPDFFFARQVRFLVVPKIEMRNGAILARNELESRNLKVIKGPFRQCLAVDGQRELGILVFSFPLDELNNAATDQPFRRLCHLAEFAATRRMQKTKKLPFHYRIAEESREYKARDQARRSRDKQRKSESHGPERATHEGIYHDEHGHEMRSAQESSESTVDFGTYDVEW